METTTPKVGDKLKLTRGEVLSRIMIDKTPREYTGSRQGQMYYIGQCDGIGFTASPEMLQEWQTGKIAEVNLTFKTYTRMVDNPTKPGEKMAQERSGWSVDGYVTYDMLKGITKAEGELKLIDRQLELDYRLTVAQKMKDLQLDDKAMEALKEAI